jgi:phage tail sheath protein FI
MPVVPTFPGVYIEELPSEVRTIVGVATSIAAFIGRALRGPTHEPVRIQSYADYERQFGGLWLGSTMSYAVQQYFTNGGTDAIIVRVEHNALTASVSMAGDGGGPATDFEAANPGAWGANLYVGVDHQVSDTTNTQLFNLYIREITPSGDMLNSETFLNVSADPLSPRHVDSVLKQQSKLLRVSTSSTTRPAETVDGSGNVIFPPVKAPAVVTAQQLTVGANANGTAISAVDIFTGANFQTLHKGLWALDKADLFNLLCLPPYDRDVAADTTTDISQTDYDTALDYCKDRRAMLIMDPPDGWVDVASAVTGAASLTRDPQSAIYFPRVRLADPLRDNKLATFVPCGVMAGVMARTDSQRGVWKAPAGTETALLGVREFSVKMTDGENGQLNPLGINCLRTFPVIGNVSWGARTTHGADILASQWKYIPVRRLANYIEESLYRGTQWAVFEPNDEPLWMQLRLNIGGFMQDLFRKGAFQGSSPREAYLVKCDSETTTQGDIDRGIVNIIVGFAPLKPAEFVIIKITQLAGQQQA